MCVCVYMCVSRTGTCVLLMFIFRPASFLCSSRERVRLSTYFISFGNCANLLIKKKKKRIKILVLFELDNKLSLSDYHGPIMCWTFETGRWVCVVVLLIGHAKYRKRGPPPRLSFPVLGIRINCLNNWMIGEERKKQGTACECSKLCGTGS